MKEPIIEFKDFTFKYDAQKKPTLKNINLTINKGEKVLIVGLSGSGKSTLGNCLNGLIPFVYEGEISGSLKIKGKETRELSVSELSKTVGTVLQDSDGQFVGLNVGEDIAFSLENDNVPLETMKAKVKGIAEMVNMDDYLDQSPMELSGGQKQRVALAGVLVDSVDILLFDEPLANLDPATGRTAIALIDDLKKETDSTVIIIEHRLEDVLYRHVDRIILIKEGEIVLDDTPDNILATDVLLDCGIREPLYVSAAKFAGVKISADMHPSSIDSFTLNDEDKKKILSWAKSHMDKVDKPHDTLLEGKGLRFSYDGLKEIIKGIDFKIDRGEMFAIIGKNGAGKSTLAKLLVGFEKEDAGTITLEGRDIKNDTIFERGKEIGIVLQNPNQMICNTMIFDEVAYGLRNAGNITEEEIKERVEETLKICGLYEFRNWPISALSYGQKKRVTIASILVMKPKIMILDEPTAGQDYRHYTEIMEFLERLNAQGQTIIMITHDMHLMLEYCDRCITLVDGTIYFEGLPSKALVDDKITAKANLKMTSLYDLAKMIGMEPDDFTQSYINAERGMRHEKDQTVRL